MAQGELPLLGTVHPHLTRFELSWADRLEVPDRPTEQELRGGELDPVQGSVAVLHEGPGDLVPVRAAVILCIIGQHSLGSFYSSFSLRLLSGLRAELTL